MCVINFIFSTTDSLAVPIHLPAQGTINIITLEKFLSYFLIHLGDASMCMCVYMNMHLKNLLELQ